MSWYFPPPTHVCKYSYWFGRLGTVVFQLFGDWPMCISPQSCTMSAKPNTNRYWLAFHPLSHWMHNTIRCCHMSTIDVTWIALFSPSSPQCIGSSLLLAHDDDRDRVNVWMIDFGRTVLLPEDVRITHSDPYRPGNHEDGYLVGLNSLIRLFEELLPPLASGTVLVGDGESWDWLFSHVLLLFSSFVYPPPVHL